MSLLRRYKSQKISASKSSNHKRLRFESLEQRNLLAGDVAVSVVGGNLSIVGGAGDDQLDFASTATAGEYVVTGLGGTMVMGGTSFTVGGVVGDVSVDLGAGAFNSFFMVDTSLPGGFQYTGAGTQDVVFLGPQSLAATQETVGGDVSISMNGVNGTFAALSMDIAGDVTVGGTAEYLGESVALGSLTVGGSIDLDVLLDNTNVLLVNIDYVGGDVNLNLRGDGGNNDLEINPVFLDSDITGRMVIAGNLNYTTTDDVDEGLIRQVDIGGDLVAVTGAISNRLVTTETTANGDILFTGGTGDDSIVFSDVTAGNDLVYNGGDGDDTLELLGVSVGDDIRLTDGAGASEFLIDDITTGDDLRIKAGAGGVSVQASEINIADDLIFKGGDGDDIFFFESVGVTNIIGDDLYATGRAGADEISIEDVQIADKLRISTGSGDDFAGIVNSTIGRSALVSLGSGVNESEIEGVDAGRSLTVLGRGTNTISLTDVTSTYFVTILTASGDDVVEMTGVTTHSALVSTKAGMDEVTITDSTFDYLFVLLGSGDDSLTLDNVTVNRFAFLNGGSGDDTLVDVGDASDINFEIDFAFEPIGT